MAANGMTNGMGSALLVPALRLPALPDAAAPTPASQQDARVPLPASGDDCDVSMDLTADLAGIIDVPEEEARLRAQAWRFEQTFEARAKQHFGSRLVEYKRNMASNAAGGWSEPCRGHECARGCGGEQCPVGCPVKRCLRTAIWPCARQCARNSTAIVHTLPWRCMRTYPLTLRLASLRFAISSRGRVEISLHFSCGSAWTVIKSFNESVICTCASEYKMSDGSNTLKEHAKVLDTSRQFTNTEKSTIAWDTCGPHGTCADGVNGNLMVLWKTVAATAVSAWG